MSFLNWLRFLLKRKIIVGLLIAFILMIGSYSVIKLDKELFPSMNFGGAFAEVYASDLPATEVEESITIPIEQALLAIDGVDDVQSSSYQGRSSLTIFTDEGKIDDIYPDIELAINSQITNHPSVQDVLVGQMSTDQPYDFFMDLSGENMEEITHFAKYVLEPRLENLSEVRDVAFEGLYQEEVSIKLDRNKLLDHQVDLHQVISVIQEANSDAVVGQFSEDENTPTIRYQASIEEVNHLNKLEIPTVEGSVLLEQLGTIELIPSEQSSLVWKNGSKDFIMVQVGRTTGTTQIDMSHAVLDEVEKMHDEGLIGDNFELEYVVSQAEYVEDALNGITSNIMIGGLLALVVLVLFLRNLRATFIIALAIPASILLTFTTMWLLDYSFNMLSLIALGLGIGLLIDSSIVILESIYSKKEQGYNNLEAVIEGTKEVATAVIASMLTTVVVFVPIGLLGGEIGQFMVILSVVIAITLISSVIVAFTLIPSLAENFMKLRKTKESREEGFIKKQYGQIVHWVTKKKRNSLAVIAGFFVLFISSFFLLTKIPSNVMPDVMNRYNEIMVNLEAGVTLDEKDEMAAVISEELQNIQDVDTSYIIDNGLALYVLINMTKDDEITREQKDVNDDIFESLREIQEDYPIAQVMSSLDMSGGFPVAVMVTGENINDLSDVSNDLVSELEKIDSITEAKSSVERTSFEKVIELDEEAIKGAGLSEQQIKQFVEQAFFQLQIGTLKVNNETVPINMAWDSGITTESDLLDLTIPTMNGERSLSNFVSFKEIEVPNEIGRSNGERYVMITAEYEGSDLGSINRDVQALIKDYETPDGIQIDIAGDLEAQQELMTEMLIIIGISIFLVYFVMAVQFNHLFHPLIVMASIPTMVIGVFIGLFVTQSELNILSGMGLIILIGIVLNNAILLIDRTKQLRLKGYQVAEALVEAGKNRIRPIFMTSLTTVFGMIPLALASGTSGNYQAPLAIVIIFGLLFSTLITLLLIPAIYRLFTTKKGELKQLQKVETESAS